MVNFLYFKSELPYNEIEHKQDCKAMEPLYGTVVMRFAKASSKPNAFATLCLIERNRPADSPSVLVFLMFKYDYIQMALKKAIWYDFNITIKFDKIVL